MQPQYGPLAWRLVAAMASDEMFQQDMRAPENGPAGRGGAAFRIQAIHGGRNGWRAGDPKKHRTLRGAAGAGSRVQRGAAGAAGRETNAAG